MCLCDYRGIIFYMKFYSKLKIFPLIVLLPFFIFYVFANPSATLAQAEVFSRSLSVGSTGADVMAMQKIFNTDIDTVITFFGNGSPGLETNYFGSLTRTAVMKFQKKYASEILAVGQAPTGFVGPKTLKKLNAMVQAKTVVVNQVKIVTPPSSLSLPISNQSVSSAQTSISPVPTILSVYPSRARRGDMVTVTGTNFTPTGNTVTLVDGPVSTHFDNLSSPNGKTITFIFEPPEIKTMSEAEIRVLPVSAVEQIEKPIKAAGKTLSDALLPYQNIRSESELKASLQKNGHSFDEIYNFYFVTVENSAGTAVSKTAIFHGLRSLPIPGLAKGGSDYTLSSLGKYIGKLLSPLFPIAYAQMGGQYGGGINTGIIMICTCGDGYLTFMTDYGGGGSGLYVFSWGFMADVGAGFISPNWLGGYQTMSGTCSIYVGVECVDIPANQAETPWGTNLF